MLKAIVFLEQLPYPIVKMGNNALNVNTNTQNNKHVDIGITVRGSDLYFAICAIMVCINDCFAPKDRVG